MLSTYCGPSWKQDYKKKHQHRTDWECRKHDKAYGVIQSENSFWTPYVYYNEADEKFIENLSHISPGSWKEAVIQNVGSGFFKGKRYLAPSLNINQKRTKIEAEEALENDIINLGGTGNMNKLQNNAYTPALKRIKRKRSIKAKGATLSKRQKASVKRLLHKKDWVTTLESTGRFYNDMGCAMNKVSYHILPYIANATVSSLLGAFSYTVRDGAGSGSVVRTLNSGADSGEKIKVKIEPRMELYNNTNTQGQVIVYVTQCLEYTNDTAYTEVTNMRTAQYQGVIPSITDDHIQYFSVPGQKRKDWKVTETFKVDLKGGEQSLIQMKPQIMTVDVDRWLAEGSPSFCPGFTQVHVRIVGRPSHFNLITTPAAVGDIEKYGNQGTQAFRFDYALQWKTTQYLLGHPDVVKVYNPNVTFGLYVPVAIGDKVIGADPELPSVAPPQQA